MKEKLILKTNEDIRTMTDPYRITILRIFSKNEGQPLTVKDVADAMGEPHGKVYYHIKKLLDFGALRLSHTEKVKGFTAKYYEVDFKHLDFEYQESAPDVSDDLLTNQAKTLITKLFEDNQKEMIHFIDAIKPLKTSLSEEGYDDETIKYIADTQLSYSNLYFTPETYSDFKDEILALFEKYKAPIEGDHVIEKEVMIAVYGDLDKINKRFLDK